MINQFDTINKALNKVIKEEDCKPSLKQLSLYLLDDVDKMAAFFTLVAYLCTQVPGVTEHIIVSIIEYPIPRNLK